MVIYSKVSVPIRRNVKVYINLFEEIQSSSAQSECSKSIAVFGDELFYKEEIQKKDVTVQGVRVKSISITTNDINLKLRKKITSVVQNSTVSVYYQAPVRF